VIRLSSSISIVIPSLNQGHFLEDGIKSLLDQRGVNLQIALVDGGSTDQTREIILRYESEFGYLRSSSDRGQAAAINEGILRLANATYVGWLNADDLLLPDGLRAMAYFLDHHLEHVAIFGKAHIIDETGKIIGDYPTRAFNKKTFAVNCTICQPASLIRGWAWNAIGGLDESIQTCLDYDLWWRLSKIGKIGYLEKFVACSRYHTQTKTRKLRKKVNDEAISILLRHWGMVPKNWCMANILEGLVDCHKNTRLGRRWEATKRYLQINRWKALLPQNWLLWEIKK
jgi:glycosyltransferase involved in cell wall biosynthesis